MRLLKIRDDCTVALTKDLNRDEKVPPYAILSHTWQDGEEVTFDDLATGTGNRKAGWEKIRFCAQQAKCDELRHFWIDTCCINKADHIELQIAINSMFHWYRDAAACYVFLPDVWASPSSKLSTWQRAFQDSRWFTRGWTLQELLAPRVVNFFTRDGVRLGDRVELKHTIHHITGIPVIALEGASLDDFTVYERLSWSEKRRTTHPEDRAYSLLGIFDVYLLPNYGEGEKNAFKRLHEEVQKPLAELQKRFNDLSETISQIQQQIQNRPKELGFPWERSIPDGQLRIDDGLGMEYVLPVELCETPEAFFDLFKWKYESRKLPGLLQVQRGHYLLWEWNERHLVSRENWSLVVKGDRAVKVSFVLGAWKGPPHNRCMRCFKPRSSIVTGSSFKKCHFCKLAVRWVEPDFLPFEPIDTVILNKDTYRDYRVRSRLPQTREVPKVPKAFVRQTIEEHEEDTPPTIDLVGHRFTMKWEPIFNIVHRYLFCRCVVRLSTPSRLSEEMTFFSISVCPRHNTQGISFRDYSELAPPCHLDPYFDQFGGYNAFWALLESYVPRIYEYLGGSTVVAEEKLMDGYLDLARKVKDDVRAVGGIASTYMSEVEKEFADRRNIQPPANSTSTESTQEKPGGQKANDNTSTNSNLIEKCMAEMRKQIRDSHVGRELKKIENGKWDGIPHWTIED